MWLVPPSGGGHRLKVRGKEESRSLHACSLSIHRSHTTLSLPKFEELPVVRAEVRSLSCLNSFQKKGTTRYCVLFRSTAASNNFENSGSGDVVTFLTQTAACMRGTSKRNRDTVPPGMYWHQVDSYLPQQRSPALNSGICSIR